MVPGRLTFDFGMHFYFWQWIYVPASAWTKAGISEHSLSTCWSWPKKEAALRPAGDRVWNQLDQTLAVGPLFREVLTQAAYSDAGARFTQALIEGIFFLIFFSF